MSKPYRSSAAFGRVLACAVVGTVAGCSHEVESPSVTLSHLEPDVICGDQFPDGALIVEVHGSGFTPMPFDALEKPQLELPNVLLTRAQMLDGSDGGEETLEFSGIPEKPNADHLGYQTKELMTLRFDDDLRPEPGIYSVEVTNPDGKHSATLPVGLAVVPPPTITGPDPLAYCTPDEDGTLTIQGTNFLQIGDAMPTVTFAGAETFTIAASELGGCIPIEGLSEPIRLCTEATVAIPGGTLPGGEYDVTLQNPDPAGCVSTDSIRLTVLDEGPILFYSDPPVAYSGINTKLTLFLTAISQPATVSIAPSDGNGDRVELDSEAVADRDNRLQATLLSGGDATAYDITVTDDLGCATTLESGLTITSELALSLDRVIPSFGYEPESTSVSIERGDDGAEFAPTPRGFLNPPDPDGVAIALESLTFVDGDHLNAVVPEGTPVGTYQLVIVNPSPGNEVGVLDDAFISVADPPPAIADIVPQSIVDQSDQAISIYGENFRDATVTVSCVDADGSSAGNPDVNTGTADCNDDGCTLTATVDGSGLVPGNVCVVRATNADGSYIDFSAIGVTNSSYNLSEPRAGATMLEARRALGSAAVKATNASRFVYAIGGDNGDVGGALSSVEFAQVDISGTMFDFVANAESLGGPRTFAGTTTVGRYVYVFGGSDGMDALVSGQRAQVLSPEEVPHIEDLDLCLSGRRDGCWGEAEPGPGLPPGGYAYRVSAVIDAQDPQNLGGETLASDPIIVKLPDFDGENILVELTWSEPLDVLGEPLTGVVGYRVYRIPVDGIPGKDEVLLAELDDADTRRFVDNGTAELGTAVPRRLGSTSAWQALPDLGTGRMGPAAAAARDPEDADTWYVYALLGKSGGSEGSGAMLDSYEYLTLTSLPNGKQTLSDSWTEGASTSAVGRWQAGAWTVDSVVSAEVSAPDTFIYLGGGAIDGDTDGTVEAGLVRAGGDLGSFTAEEGFSNVRVGYGTAAAAGRLFCFGGNASGPKSDATAALIENPAPTLSNNAWNNEGLQMTTARYLAGSSIQSAFIFLLGGDTDGSGAVTNTTETVVW